MLLDQGPAARTPSSLGSPSGRWGPSESGGEAIGQLQQRLSLSVGVVDGLSPRAGAAGVATVVLALRVVRLPEGPGFGRVGVRRELLRRTG